MSLLRRGNIYKCCLLLLSVASWQFVYSEAFLPRNKKSSLAKTAVNLPYVPRLSQLSKLQTVKFPESNWGNEKNGLHVRGGDNSAQQQKKNLVREMIAEFIGTFLIVQIGTGAVMSAVYSNSLVGLFQIASTWIIAVTVAICTTAKISGAHLNPAVSVAFAMIRPSSFDWRKKLIPYSIAQLLGAICASWINFTLFASTIVAFESANGIVRSSASAIASAKAFGQYFLSPVSTTTAFLAEFIGTAILGFVIFALTNPRNEAMKDSFVPPIIGATVGALIAVLAPLTQAGFNPARDFGPRIIAFLAGWKTVAFQGWWVYVLAPIFGAPFGAAIADKVLYSE